VSTEVDPVVSVIVTTKNEEKNIGACLENLVQQSMPPLEMIVVDNFSEDKTIYKCLTNHKISTNSEGSAETFSLQPGDKRKDTEILASVPELRIPKLNGKSSTFPSRSNNDVEPVISKLDKEVEFELLANQSSANLCV